MKFFPKLKSFPTELVQAIYLCKQKGGGSDINWAMKQKSRAFGYVGELC